MALDRSRRHSRFVTPCVPCETVPPSQSTARVLVTLVLALATGCGKAKPATRAEALGACNTGCFQSASKSHDASVSRTYCNAYCDCFIGARFDASGKQRKTSPEELQRNISDCAGLGLAKAGQTQH